MKKITSLAPWHQKNMLSPKRKGSFPKQPFLRGDVNSPGVFVGSFCLPVGPCAKVLGDVVDGRGVVDDKLSPQP